MGLPGQRYAFQESKMFLLGFDVGSSSVKACLLDAHSGRVTASATSPATELPMNAPRPGWAQQDPEVWWTHLKRAAEQLRTAAPAAYKNIKAIGIAYQMHGLVAVDRGGNVLRPAIIWCDSRAVETGNQAAAALGEHACLKELYNLPGNFTASKLAWVKQNEPEIYRQIDKIMLPGDYIAYRLTGRITTTISGLSEGIFWNFRRHQPAQMLLDYYGIDAALLPELCPTFGVQGELNPAAAKELGLPAGIMLTYRAGDQPNNAFSLRALQPGDMAATAGTSGVVYGVMDDIAPDRASRVNIFAHVNHQPQRQRLGVLLCVNGTGILNSWLKHQVMGAGEDYPAMNILAEAAPVGAEGLMVFPYGNGAERTLGNRNPGASVHGLNFNIHSRGHLLRAAQEGIVFALNYGVAIMRKMGIKPTRICAGRANMFLSPLFCRAFASLTGAPVELYRTDGAQGAARGAGLGGDIFPATDDAFIGLDAVDIIPPDERLAPLYEHIFRQWCDKLENMLANK